MPHAGLPLRYKVPSTIVITLILAPCMYVHLRRYQAYQLKAYLPIAYMSFSGRPRVIRGPPPGMWPSLWVTYDTERVCFHILLTDAATGRVPFVRKWEEGNSACITSAVKTMTHFMSFLKPRLTGVTNTWLLPWSQSCVTGMSSHTLIWT